MKGPELKGKPKGTQERQEDINPLGSSRLENGSCDTLYGMTGFVTKNNDLLSALQDGGVLEKTHVKNHFAASRLKPNTCPQNILSLGYPSKLNKPDFVQDISSEAQD